jgi:hypothetical protein
MADAIVLVRSHGRGLEVHGQGDGLPLSLFIVLYCYLEKLLAREDYRKGLDIRERQLQVWSR